LKILLYEYIDDQAFGNTMSFFVDEVVKEKKIVKVLNKNDEVDRIASISSFN